MAVICETSPGTYQYRGERLRDGANVQLANAVPAGGGFDAMNPADGARYEVRPGPVADPQRRQRRLRRARAAVRDALAFAPTPTTSAAVPRLVPRRSVDTPAMEERNDAPENPKDAREATEEQRELQEEFDHQNDDPDAPGGHQTRKQVADET